MTTFTKLIASPPDRECVVYEIWLGNSQVAEISREPGKSLEIQISPLPEGGWRFDLDEFLAALGNGAKVLSESRK
ncbi:hypothetical protein BUW96_08555 [Achromobacter insolitus]|nr:hypothetical protein BUW96_08555 [Achromobacter insolitus]OWT55527.1 hypothetical protein CEY08_25205 [Achromobacter insolitus]